MQTMHHFVLPKVCLVFSQRTCPIRFFRPKTHVLGGFARFRCRKVPVAKTGAGVDTMHHIVLPKVFLVLSQRTCPIHYFRSKTHVWGGFTRFHCGTGPVVKTGPGVHYVHAFVPLELLLVFSQQTCPIHYFKSKTHAWGGFT